MSVRKAAVVLAVMAVGVGGGALGLQGQDAPNEVIRRAKSKVEPIYPELAKKMNIAGVVRVQVVVAANGTVKEAKVVGGHPLLANAALDAVKKWRFEPAPGESSGVVDFKFEPHQ